MGRYSLLARSQSQQGSKPSILGIVWDTIAPPLFKLMNLLLILLSAITPFAFFFAFGGIAYLMLFKSPTKVSKRLAYWFIVAALFPIIMVVLFVLTRRLRGFKLGQIFRCATPITKKV